MLAQVFFAQYFPYDHYPGKSIALQYRRWDGAYIRRDTRVARDILAKDFRLVTVGGNEIDKAAYLVSFKDGAAPDEYSTKMIRIQIRRGRAKVWTKETTDHEIHYYLDTWIQERSKWRLLGSTTLREQRH